MVPDYGIDISEFIADVSDELQGVKSRKLCFEGIKNIPLIKGKQCLYVMDWQTLKMTYLRGVEEMLGYTEKDFVFDLVLKYLHPDDAKFVNRIVKGAVEQSVRENVSGERPFLNLTYRLKKKDGSYLKVLRRSTAYEIDSQGRLVSNFSLLTDISFISNNDKVEWDIHLDGINVEDFNNSIRNEFVDFFTSREKQIIGLIHKGFNSRQIGRKLNISYHTVSTHRKNIFKKSRCHSTHELMSFCIKNGII
ncbi:PAS domain-containing protein [Hyunsoonleella sp. SJ7]|uniref:PAS domain-containing protein n=1 Tax=Hyunsoonleella aquatilis TaxID=2762758 RepID=A0A923KGF5_9FLAO|nr:LuxR C-terminal-related transcriptional regulator [Hyunsoonleella aquatilis]MBC3758181.1 PAS domain-containing protein [Hyunsoonleella aquatilis]